MSRKLFVGSVSARLGSGVDLGPTGLPITQMVRRFFRQVSFSFGATPLLASFATAVGNDAGAVTINKPSATLAGDLLVAVVAIAFGGATWTSPAGWTTVTGDVTNGSVTANTFQKIATGSEPASYTFTHSGPAALNKSAGIARITDASRSNPIDVSANGTGSSATPTCPTATTTVKRTLILRVMAQADTTTDDTGEPAGTTLVWVKGNTTVTSGMATEDQSEIGATGTAAFSVDNSAAWVASTIAARPP